MIRSAVTGPIPGSVWSSVAARTIEVDGPGTGCRTGLTLARRAGRTTRCFRPGPAGRRAGSRECDPQMGPETLHRPGTQSGHARQILRTGEGSVLLAIAHDAHRNGRAHSRQPVQLLLRCHIGVDRLSRSQVAGFDGPSFPPRSRRPPAGCPRSTADPQVAPPPVQARRSETAPEPPRQGAGRHAACSSFLPPSPLPPRREIRAGHVPGSHGRPLSGAFP